MARPMRKSFDYIIVGAGSAGCVMANRLSADPSVEVLLLEAGPRDWNPFIHMPAGLSKLVNFKSLNWNYNTEPEPALNNRRLYWPRGRVLGGSSSINAMCYSRGHRSDYDDWAELGNPGWSWKEVLPYFRQAENQSRGESELHGVGGPLSVEDLSFTNPLSDVFIEAAGQAGFAHNRDFNGPAQRGVGLYQVTQSNGRRCSAAVAYLRPIRSRPNLSVVTRAMALGLEFSNNDRVSGVSYRARGLTRTVEARREVILAGGAINSPQMLMLSGIGPAPMLENAGIRVRHELPEVGRNLQDHLDICTLTRCSQPVTYDQLSELRVGLKYFLHHEGEGTSNIAEAGGFLQVVGHVQAGQAVAAHQAFQIGPDGAARGAIQGGEGFVQEQGRRVRQHRPRQGHALPLATGKLMGSAAQQWAQVQHADERVAVGRGLPGPLAREFQVARHVQMGQQASALEDHAQGAAMGGQEKAGGFVLQDALPQPHFPVGSGFEAGHRPQQGGLAAPAGPVHDAVPAGGYFQVHIQPETLAPGQLLPDAPGAHRTISRPERFRNCTSSRSRKDSASSTAASPWAWSKRRAST